MSELITAGSTDQTIDIFLQDSSSASGAGLTGLAFNSSGLKCYYRKGATGSATQLTLATQTVGGSHTDGGFVEIDSTNAPGLYRLDLSDTMVAAEGFVSIYLHGATNLLQTALRINCRTLAADVVKVSGDSTAADNLELDYDGTGYNKSNSTIGTTTTNTDMRGTDSAFLASSAPSNFSSLGINGSGHISQVTLVDTTTSNTDMVDVSSLATETSIAALNNFDPSTQTVTTDSASRTASQADVSALATAVNLATVDAVVDAIKTVTDKLDDTLELDSTVYRFTTNALEQAPTGGGSAPTEAEIYTYFTASSREDVFKADVSSLATAANLTTVDTVVDGIKAVTDNLPNSGALTDLATAAALATVDTVVDDIKVATDKLDDTFELDGSDYRFTANALEEAPTGGGGSAPTEAEIYTYFTASSREDVFKADVSALATAVSISALNDLSSADVTAAVPTAASIADAVLDESLSGHNVAGSVGKALRQLKEGVISVEGSVDDSSATTTTFVSNLTETTDGFYHDKVMVFISGDLACQARHIETYTGSTKSITVSQGFTSAPADCDEFLILATHEHSINEIQAGLATAASITALNDISVADVLTSVLTESYATDGAAPTLTQAVMLILQHLSESSITGTTKTVKQLDGSTTAATFTLDDASSPSSITRAT